MEKSTVILFVVVAVISLIHNAEPAPGSRCPPVSQVYIHKPVCRDDYDCKHGKVCCPNSSHTKSCVEPGRGGSDYDKYKGMSGGPGRYCGNVKCMPYENCQKDPRTGKLTCMRY